MKRKLQAFCIVLFFMLLFGAWNTETVKAQETQEILTVKYYMDSVQDGNYIGEQTVEYPGLSLISDVLQLQLSDEVIQAYHQNGYPAERCRSGKLVSYDSSTGTACVVYEKVTYTVAFYQDSVEGTSLGSVTQKGFIGDVITNRYLGKSVRNTFQPSGYLPGQVYQQVRLSDADDIVVQVVYHPIVNQSKIYFYNVVGTSDYGSDAILIESDGHFGLIDCGEDLDYPKGNDSRYPARSGISTEAYANPQDLINFIASKGVTELDFIIFTHAHSDHMGAADEIMAAFDVGTVYAREYNDKYITSSDRLWDTQYVYDCMVQAAQRYGITLVQNFNAENTTFQLQDLKIQIKNYETDYEADGVTRQAKWDENENSLGVLVTDTWGNKVFLAGDIDNIDGDEDKLAQDEDLHNITVLKLAHHGYAHSSTANYLNALYPRYAVVTNSQYMMDQTTYNQLVNMGTQMYFVASCKEGITLDIPQIQFTKEKEYSGWEYDQGLKKTYYYVEGEKLRDCEKEIDGKVYRFHRDGSIYNMEWYENPATGDWYYYGENSSLVKDDWLLYKDRYYYLGSDGRMATNAWITWKGKTYYLQDDGVMVSAKWLNVNGKYYYFDNSGIMATDQWLLIDGKWYYLDTDHSRVNHKWITYKGSQYYFDADGKMVTNAWAEQNGKWYYLKSDGTVYVGSGWKNLNNRWYYLRSDSSRMTNEWLLDNGTWYYLGENGAMLSGQWGHIDGRWYYFKSGGAMVSDGWHKINNTWYYFEKSGAMYENQWVYDSKKWYYMGSDGAMVAANWCQVDGKWYYFDPSGVMLAEKWGCINGKWYYFGRSGAMYENQWLKDKGKWYYLKSSGEMLTSGWLFSGGSWYYLQADGSMAVNTTIGGKHVVNSKGVWVN